MRERSTTTFSGTPISVVTLVRQLQELGLRAGDVVMPHVSMRRVGKVEGGTAGLLQALKQTLGPTGTIVMVLSAHADESFDAQLTPVDTEDMGVFAETFRRSTDVSVNDHAADRFAALGPDAQALLEPTPLHDYHGPGSVLERFTARNGRVLRLGANVDTVTLTHYAEYLADIPNKIRARRRYVRADIGEQWIDSLDDTDGIAVWAHGDYFPQIFLDYKGSGEDPGLDAGQRGSSQVRVGPVGQCIAELFDAQPFVAFATQWMNKNLTGANRVDEAQART